VSDYGLDDRAIEVRSPAEVKIFFPLASVSKPALRPTQPPVQWVPGVLSPAVKARPGRDADLSPHLVPRSRTSRSYTPLPQSASMACSGTALPFSISGCYVQNPSLDTAVFLFQNSTHKLSVVGNWFPDTATKIVKSLLIY
jgi:hypothetical protein